MVHGLAFFLFAAELVWVMTAGVPALYVLAWPAVAFVVGGAAYLSGRSELFGKSPSGQFHPAAIALYLPYFGIVALSFGLRQLIRSGARSNEILPGLWLGERTSELPDGIERIVDLTAEHPRIDRDVEEYILVPTLDGQAPDPQAMRAAIDRIVQNPRPTYVHCWAGKGRSATFVAAYLLHIGEVATVAEAESFIQHRRPIVLLSRPQREVAALFVGSPMAVGPSRRRPRSR